MKSLTRFVFSTIGVTLLWALSGIVPFIILVMPGLEGVFNPSPGELALLACCYGGGALFWVVFSAEVAAMISRRSIVGWTAVQTAGLLIALPVMGSSLPMLMIIMAGLGCMSGVVWAVWFPILLETDYRIRPGMVAVFFVTLYSSAAVGIPVSVEMVKNVGVLPTLMVLGAIGFFAALLVSATSKSMLRPSRLLAPVSYFRLGKATIKGLFNLSFLFFCLLALPAFSWMLQTLEHGVLSIGLAEKLRIDQSGLLWIVGISRAPALAVLLTTMPSIRHGIPLRYFGLGLLISGASLPILITTTNAFAFTGAYMVCFAAVGLCWGAYFASISAAVSRDNREAGLIVAGMALVTGLLAVSGWQWLSHYLTLDHSRVFFVTAAGVGSLGGVTLLASCISALNGARQGGHFEEDQQPDPPNFRKFTYGNPRG